MIAGIYVRQFQSIREAQISLGRLTVVVGSTNVGKSAFLRALKALVENRRGDSFIYDGASECQVSVQTDKSVVTWYKQKKKSATYLVDNKEATYAWASQVLRISKVELSKAISLLLNFQNQLDAPFLLAESDIIKSKVLGEITNAGVILIAINQIKRWSMSNASLLSVRESDVQQTKNKLVKYELLPDMSGRLAFTAGLVQKIKDLVGLSGNLSRICNDLMQVSRRMNALSAHVQRVGNTHDRISSTYFGSPKIHVDVQNLTNLRDYSARIDAEIVVARKIKAKVDIIDGHMPDVTMIEHWLNNLAVVVGYKEALDGNKATLEMLTKQSDETEAQLSMTDRELSKLRIELKVCPLCEAALV